MSEAASTTDFTPSDFDFEALRVKYRDERDKRMKSEGTAQYQEVNGDFSHYVDDPYVEAEFTREALDDEVDALIIGGGFGGLLRRRATSRGRGRARTNLVLPFGERLVRQGN
jgi:cyclohexanone monooxygenase